MRGTIKRLMAAAFAAVVIMTETLAGGTVRAYADEINGINGSNADYAQSERDNVVQPDSSLVLIYGPDTIMVEAGKKYTVVQRFLLKEGTKNYTDPIFIGSSADRMVSITPVEVRRYGQSSISNDTWLRYNVAVEVAYEISVSPLAKVGKVEYGITAYDSRPVTFDESRNPVYANTGAFKITLDVVTASSDPMFALESDPAVSGKAGEYITIPVDMVNVGELDAYDVYVAIGGHNSLVASGTAMKQKMPSTPAGGTIRAEFSFKVDPEAKSDKFNLPITVTCRDYSGVQYSDSSYYVVVDIQGKEEFTKPSSYIVKNVKQSPEKPKAGENVTITFDLENNGDTDFRNIKIVLDGVSSNGFEPIDSNPYYILGDLNARKTKTVKLTYKCGKGISGGTNALSLTFDGEDKHGTDVDGRATVYVLNVEPSRSGEGSNAVSKPKLMVSGFTTDLEEILASSKFEFKFKIKNTNAESVARNIKVKVTSNSFSVAAGSNTFFVSDILPGEEKELSINLKASSALQTGAYPINIEMEYEYDVEKVTEAGNSVSANDEILLQVNELLRAQCENISLGDWEGVSLGSPCPLTFEFYNMGRSTLNNVYVTIEGDFELATGNSYYIGNIGPGNPEFVECTVRPLVSGDANCKIIIHMEDSNGEEVTKENYTSTFVSETAGNGGFGGDIGIDFPIIPGGDTGFENPADGGEEGKKISPFVFVGAGVAVVVIAIIVVVVLKKKKQNRELNEFDD